MVRNKEKLGQYRHFCKCCRKKTKDTLSQTKQSSLGFRDFHHSGSLISNSTCYHSQLPIICIKMKGEKTQGHDAFQSSVLLLRQSHLSPHQRRGGHITCGSLWTKAGWGLRSLCDSLSWRQWHSLNTEHWNRVFWRTRMPISQQLSQLKTLLLERKAWCYYRYTVKCLPDINSWLH